MASDLKQFTREEVAKHNKDTDLWIIIDGKVFDVTRFKDIHPGGSSVFFEEDIAGQDATETFYGLHRHEIITRPQYARLQVGTIVGEKSVIFSRVTGELSKVPYAEPTWLSPGYHSPYYTESHKKFQKYLRAFVDEFVTPDALAREQDGKPPSQSVIEAMAKMGLHAMRMGPGKHLKGLELAGGLIKPEEFDYFHEVIAML